MNSLRKPNLEKSAASVEQAGTDTRGAEGTSPPFSAAAPVAICQRRMPSTQAGKRDQRVVKILPNVFCSFTGIP